MLIRYFSSVALGKYFYLVYLMPSLFISNGKFAIVSAWHGLQTNREFTSTWLSLVNDHTSLPELLLSPTFAFIVIHTVVVPLVVLNRYQKICWILMYNMHGFNFLYFLMEIWNHLIPNFKWWLGWKHGDFVLMLLWLVVVYWWQLESWALSLNPDEVWMIWMISPWDVGVAPIHAQVFS